MTCRQEYQQLLANLRNKGGKMNKKMISVIILGALLSACIIAPPGGWRGHGGDGGGGRKHSSEGRGDRR